ncbi:hypothetical protein UlMin_040526 [Ulmus minor]
MRLQNLAVLIFFWISILLTCTFLAESSYEACEPRNCGSGPNISFPFFVDGATENCGLQSGFKIFCEQNKPIFQTTRGSYVVKDISYQNQSIVLVDLDILNVTCFIPKHYFVFDRLPSDLFNFSSSHTNLNFFLKCNTSFSRPYDKLLVPCASNSTRSSYVALVPSDLDLGTAAPACESKVGVPVDSKPNWPSNQTINNVNYTELLLDGFTLLWNQDTNCGECSASGGRCGTQDQARVCFCPDGSSLNIFTFQTPKTTKCNALKEKINTCVTVAGAGVLVVIIILCCLRKKSFWKKHDQAHRNVEAFLKNYGPLQVRRYSYLEVKKMTNSFSEKLGQGGYGSVYKGNLLDGFPVAVKILDKSKGDDGEEFMNEVATISRTSHVNVVTLLGFCFESTKRALIYEFMPNGSLEKFIFDKNPTMSRHHQLDWEILYRISLGIAKGLEYLHSGCNMQILHFDIKPHNVLLDGDFVPRISDFGLAKMNNREVSLVSMQGPRGTAGYIAPEIFSRSFGGVSHKSDVYSYGMMVLDMVGGRENVNIRADNTSEIYFPQWIYERIQLNEELGLERLVDEENNVKVKKMIMVSLWCIQVVPSNRPAMNKVIEMLEGNLESLQVPPKPILWSSASISLAGGSLSTLVSSET